MLKIDLCVRIGSIENSLENREARPVDLPDANQTDSSETTIAAGSVGHSTTTASAGTDTSDLQSIATTETSPLPDAPSTNTSCTANEDSTAPAQSTDGDGEMSGGLMGRRWEGVEGNGDGEEGVM